MVEDSEGVLPLFTSTSLCGIVTVRLVVVFLKVFVIFRDNVIWSVLVLIQKDLLLISECLGDLLVLPVLLLILAVACDGFKLITLLLLTFFLGWSCLIVMRHVVVVDAIEVIRLIV